MVTMALAAVVLGIAGDLMSSYASNIRFAASKDNGNLAFVALRRLADELAGSASLDSPVPGDVGVPYTDLRFLSLDPTFSPWLPTPLSLPLPASWDPFPPARMLSVHVYVSGARVLVRDVGPSVGPPTSQFVLIPDRVSQFSCTLLADQRLELKATLDDTSGPRTFLTYALRMTP